MHFESRWFFWQTIVLVRYVSSHPSPAVAASLALIGAVLFVFALQAHCAGCTDGCHHDRAKHEIQLVCFNSLPLSKFSLDRVAYAFAIARRLSVANLLFLTAHVVVRPFSNPRDNVNEVRFDPWPACFFTVDDMPDSCCACCCCAICADGVAAGAGADHDAADLV